MLNQHSWKVDWTRLHFATSVSLATPANDIGAGLQHLIYGRAIAETELAGPPIFVLGHWRSGTTLLHELLQMDERFASPNTYQCFEPWHFLISEGFFTRFGNWLLPNRRPMDNMAAGWSLPQEDEFALMALGAATTYTRVAFPRQCVTGLNSLSSTTFIGEARQRWEELLRWFLQAITYKAKAPLILKSPPHTGRLAILAEMFPTAKFVHISRDPQAMIPSTIKLWKSLDAVQALQSREDERDVEDYVFECFDRMYVGYEDGLKHVSPERIIETTYEALIADPSQTVAKIYDHLSLGNFEAVEAKIAARFEADRDYKTNQWSNEPALAQRIASECSGYFERFGI